MVPWPDRTSLGRPLLFGAAVLCFVFACVGAFVASVCSDRLADTCARSEDDHRRHAADDRRQRALTQAAESVRDVLDDTRHAADMVAREAARAAAAADPHPAVEPDFRPLGGTLLLWSESERTGTFAVLRHPDQVSATALAGWDRRMAAVLRAAMHSGDALVRTSLDLDDLGTIGAPASWAARAAVDADVEGELDPAGAAEPVPENAGWASPHTGRLVRVVPVRRDDGTRIGTVRAEADVAALAQALTAASESGTACLLVTSSGTVLARSDGARAVVGVPEDATDADWTAAVSALLGAGGGGAAAAAPQSPATASVSLDGTGLRIAAVSAVPPPVAADGVEIQTVVLARRFGWGVAGLSLAFGLACVLGAVHVANRQRERLRPVIEVARTHESGDYTTMLDDTGRGEVADVARWVNTAAVRLRAAGARAAECERRLHGLVDALGEGFVAVDAADRISQVNSRFADLVRRDGTSIVGREVGELLVPESAEVWREMSRASHESVEREVLTWATGQPPYPATLVTRIPLRTPDGHPAGAHLVVTDLTDRRRLQEEAARVQEEAARAERARALAEMAGGVAHDFNNVLTVILGNAQYLLLDELPAEARETVRAIEAAALDGTASMRRVREFARPRTVPPTADLLDPCEVVERALAEARRRTAARNAERGAEHQVLVERRSRRRVRGDREELSEAVANLIENAFESMPSGGRLVVQVFDRGEDEVAVRVVDSGVGMTPEVARKVFDPFFTTKPHSRCVGLGLSIAYGIVRAHRGRIDVRSTPGEGSAFTVVLPAGDPAPAADAIETSGSPRVLVVGSDADAARRLAEELSTIGLDATHAQPASALALVSEPGRVHVLVVEQTLADASGRDLARQARAVRGDLRIVLLTEPTDAVSETQARNAGIDGVLVRPFDAREVHAEVFSVIAAPRGRRSPGARTVSDPADDRTAIHAGPPGTPK